jgi:hypothetical protein
MSIKIEETFLIGTTLHTLGTVALFILCIYSLLLENTNRKTSENFVAGRDESETGDRLDKLKKTNRFVVIIISIGLYILFVKNNPTAIIFKLFLLVGYAGLLIYSFTYYLSPKDGYHSSQILVNLFTYSLSKPTFLILIEDIPIIQGYRLLIMTTVGLHYLSIIAPLLTSISLATRISITTGKPQLLKKINKLRNHLENHLNVLKYSIPLTGKYVSTCGKKAKTTVLCLLFIVELPISLIVYILNILSIMINFILLSVESIVKLTKYLLLPLSAIPVKAFLRKTLVVSLILTLGMLYVHFLTSYELSEAEKMIFEFILIIVLVPYLLSVLVDVQQYDNLENN